MNQLTIAGIVIKQDEEGRYCLNDFHRASGGNPKHKPSNFLRLDHIIELINEIDRVSDMSINNNQQVTKAVKTIHGGNKAGTYVVIELVYAYAMWINASFNLKVIRAVHALNTGQLQLAQQQPLQLEEAKISLDQYVELDDLMYPKKKNASDNLPWHKLYDHFGVKSVREIPASRFKDVCDWINDLPTPHSQIKTTYFLPGKEGLDRNILSLIVYNNAVLKQLREALAGNPDIAREVQIPIWQTSALLNQEPFCNHNSSSGKGTALTVAS